MFVAVVFVAGAPPRVELQPRRTHDSAAIAAVAGIHTDVQDDLVRRPATNAKIGSVPGQRLDIDEVPESSVGTHGNMMLQSCVVGKECTPQDLCEKLSKSGFDVIVVTMTTAVADDDAGLVFLNCSSCSTATYTTHQPCLFEVELVRTLVMEKAVYKVGERVFALVHRAKIPSCGYTAWNIAPQVRDGKQLLFGSLDINLDITRQRRKHIKIGIVDIRCEMDAPMAHALAEWIMHDEVAVVTGFWGKGNGEMVAQLASLGGATFKMPVYQEVVYPHPTTAVAEREGFTYPSYFLLFGKYKSVRWPPEPTEVPEWFKLGEDIRDAMENSTTLPTWKYNERGSPFVPNLGKATVKDVAFDKLPAHSFMTSVWFGAATPSQRNQQNAIHRSRGTGGGSRGKGRGKCRGKGRGKAKKD